MTMATDAARTQKARIISEPFPFLDLSNSPQAPNVSR
jgi:hypothetical protein